MAGIFHFLCFFVICEGTVSSIFFWEECQIFDDLGGSEKDLLKQGQTDYFSLLFEIAGYKQWLQMLLRGNGHCWCCSGLQINCGCVITCGEHRCRCNLVLIIQWCNVCGKSSKKLEALDKLCGKSVSNMGKTEGDSGKPSLKRQQSWQG